MARAAHVPEAVAAARTARHELGLSLEQPVHDLLAVVEETAGLPVGVLALPDGAAGVYIERRRAPPDTTVTGELGIAELDLDVAEAAGRFLCALKGRPGPLSAL